MPEMAERILKAGVLVAQRLRTGGGADVPSGALVSMLRTLHLGGPVARDALLAAGRHAPPVAAAILDDLLRGELVAERPSPSADGPVLVELTERGRAAYAHWQARSALPIARRLQTLDGQEVDLLAEGVALLERLADQPPPPAGVTPPPASR